MEKVMNEVIFTGAEYDLIKKAELKKSDTVVQFESVNNERIVRINSQNDSTMVDTKISWFDGSFPAQKTAFNFEHLKELKIGKKDRFSVYSEGENVTVDHDGMKVDFKQDHEAMDDLPLEFDSKQLVNKQVLQYLKDVNKFTSKEGTRPALTGVNFYKDYIQATDSHALKRVNVNGDFENFIIHHEAIDIVTSLLSDNFYIEQYNGGRYQVFKQSDGYLTIQVTVQTIDSNYPVTENMFPKLSMRKSDIKVNRKENQSLVKMLSKLNKKDCGIVKLNPDVDELNVIQEIKDKKKTKSLNLKTVNAGDVHEIHVSIEQLQKIVSQSEEVTLNTFGKLTPLLIFTEDQNVSMLLSPVRVY